MGRTWQISGRICLPCGKNLTSGHIAKCDPKFSSWKKLWKSQKHQRRLIAWVGQADFGKLELNNRNHGGKCQHLSAKRDRFETRSIWINRWNFLTFAFSLWTDEATTTFRPFNVFAKTFYGRAIHKLVILRYFNAFTGTLYRRANYSLPRHRQRFVILRAKCSLCSQALYFLYFSHPPETGKGRKRSYAKWVVSLAAVFETAVRETGAPNENIVQNHLNIPLLNVF